MAIYKGVGMPKQIVFIVGIICGLLLAMIIVPCMESARFEKKLEQERLKTELIREITAEVMKQLKEYNLI